MVEEPGGVGDFNGHYYMWIIEADYIYAVFDSGEFFEFYNDKAGWLEFVLSGMFIGKMF